MEILIIEDDVALRLQIKDILLANGFLVDMVTDFHNVLEIARQKSYDLIILDINLPYLDGNYFTRMIRRESNVPIIITSARNSDSDQILSMELGSDDYLVKPFNINLLISKINAILRRTANVKKTEYKGITIIENELKLKYQNREVELTKNEYKLLLIFINKPNTIIAREELLEGIWDDVSFVDDNTLTVNITRIKGKLEALGIENAIRTKRGIGYLFEVEND